MEKFSVYQHWDPLRVCVVGRSYPPEFYSWIKTPHVRSLFEKIAQETEEDYQAVIKTLEKFGVEVLRPDLVESSMRYGRYLPPPMTPRDYMVMIGDTFYANYGADFKVFYNNVRDPSWPDCQSAEEFTNLPLWIQKECIEVFEYDPEFYTNNNYSRILSRIVNQGNKIKHHFHDMFIGAMIARIGKDLYFGTDDIDQDQQELKKIINQELPNTRNHIVNTGGHSDATYCPVCPGLIISLHDVPTYADTFPGWEVVYLPGQSWSKVRPFLSLKEKNRGRWWIPGFEHDQSVIDVVETWLSHWVGYVEETVFDVNMLIIDPKNVMVFNYNKTVFDVLDRYGITAHVVPFRHRYFWDGGIHCITSDLDRSGEMQDYFPDRNRDI
jgi:hypothetical protein